MDEKLKPIRLSIDPLKNYSLGDVFNGGLVA
jgi:hypothetical protein